MKKLILTVFVISFLTSCGPHRMSCGARGICKTPNQLELVKTKSS